MLKTQIGPYQFIREIDKDSIGQSFEAVDQARNKKVILKYLRPERVTPEILPRLYSEAKTLASLNHPHIGRVFGFVRRVDQLFLVMEFLQGQTLENIFKNQGRMQPRFALALFHQILTGVAFAHRLGVIHGDLRPSNILVTDLGPIKILNFAIAHILGSSEPVDSRDSSLQYISPEQIEGGRPDVRSDIYSLGMMLYELIVGKSPFDVYGPCDDRAQGQFIPVPPSLIIPDLPKWLDEFLLRMLATSPSDRFQSVKALARVLEVEIARTNKRATSEDGLWRKNWAGSIAFSKNILLVAGNRTLESIKKAVSAVTEFSVRPARGVVHRVKAWAERAFMTFDRVVHRISSPSNYVLTPKPLLESLKNSLPDRLKTDWRRYLQAVCLLALISVESFYFHGANISLLIDTRLLSSPSLNDAVDSMFARIKQETSKPDGREISKKELASVVERQSPKRQSQLLEQPAIPTSVRVRSEPSERLPVDRSYRASPSIASNSERETNMPLVNVPKINEQNVTEPVRTTQNNTPKSELKIKWEN